MIADAYMYRKLYPNHDEPANNRVISEHGCFHNSGEYEEGLRRLFIEQEVRRPTQLEQDQRKVFFELHPELLLTTYSEVPAYSLDINAWCKYSNLLSHGSLLTKVSQSGPML